MIYSASYEINHKSEIMNLLNKYLLAVYDVESLLHLLYATALEVVDVVIALLFVRFKVVDEGGTIFILFAHQTHAYGLCYKLIDIYGRSILIRHGQIQAERNQ